MAKKILAIFFVSILLCSYIIPTTSAFADVVIGDNDSYAVTELGVQNGKRIATMEAILQLLESGVSDINFNDISDLDDYIDEFYDELTDVNYQDVSNEILAGAYNDVKELKQWIDDRGEYIATYYKDYLNSADQGLSDIFNDFQLKLPKSRLVGTSLNGVRGLSRFTRSEPTPAPPPDFTFLENIVDLRWGNTNTYIWESGKLINGRTVPNANVQSYLYNPIDSSCYNQNGNAHLSNVYVNNLLFTSLGSIYITDLGGNNNVTCSYSNFIPNMHPDPNSTYYLKEIYGLVVGTNYLEFQGVEWTRLPYTLPFQTSFAGLSTCVNYIYTHFAHVNIYYNGEPWVIVGDSTQSSPTLDIDGFIKLFGNNNPIQYEFPQGTQIDYNALYSTIYNAIRDNLPLNMQSINNNQVYYDSHDTVYSPTIYNFYGKDGDDENDWIDSILDYATIPDFNSALGTVAVLDTPFVNGITIVNAGVTDVIPSDILVIFGGFFVLVLFVCIINRMSE